MHSLKVDQGTVNQNATMIYTKIELENGSLFLNLQIVSNYECINYLLIIYIERSFA